MIDRLRRVLRVARWEAARAGGGVDRRTLLATLALLLVVGGVVGGGLAAGVVGIDVDRDVYRVAVNDDSPYADAVERAPALTAVPAEGASLGTSADLIVRDVRGIPLDDGTGGGTAGDESPIVGVVVSASDTQKGAAAAAEFRDAVETHNERLMATEENKTAAFPIFVTLRYVSRTSGVNDGATLGEPGSTSTSGGDETDRNATDATDTDDDGTDSDTTTDETDPEATDSDGGNTTAGNDTASGDDTRSGDNTTTGTDWGDDGGSAENGSVVDSGSANSDGESFAVNGETDGGDLAVPSVGGGTFGADTVGSPGSISPPFPFVSLLLAFVFLVPMNFLIQAYGSSILDERTNRRGEPLLVTPLSPVEIVAGKTLPYVVLAAAVTTLIAIVVGGGPLSVIAVFPVAMAFLGATFVGAMFARSFKELTFVTVGVSVLLTTYAFVPAIFSNVTPVALVSPLTLVVFDLQGEAVSAGDVLFSTTPMLIGAGLLFALGLGVYREEDMFTQKPVGRKFLDALAVRLAPVGVGVGADTDAPDASNTLDASDTSDASPRLRTRVRTWARTLAPVALLTACTIPFVFVAELMAVALLFALPITVSIPVLLVTIAFIEEFAKSIHLYAGFERGVFARTDHVIVAVGVASGAGFFLAEKATAVVQAVGLTELYVGRAAFGSVAGLEGLPVPVLVALVFTPLVLHGVTTTVTAVGASRGRTRYVLTLALATLIHAAYNFAVVSIHG